MSLDLRFMNFIEVDEDTGFFRLAELMVDSTTEHLHGRGQTHIGIDKRRNVHSVLSYLCVEQFVVIFEFIFA